MNLFDAILMQSKAKQPTVKQQRVIEAAIKLFAEKGYANTSTAEIAREAEVSEGTIFKHYGTKDRLLLSVVLPFIRELFPQIAKEVLTEVYSEEMSFEQFMRALIRNRVDFLADNKEIFHVFIKEVTYKDELRNELLQYAAAHVPPRMKGLAERFKARGELRDDLPVETIMKHVFTFIFGFLVSRFVILGQDTVSDAEIEEAVRFIMGGIAADGTEADGTESHPS